MADQIGRHVCTKDNPYDSKKHDRAQHPDAKATYSKDGYPGGDMQHYKCPNCGLHFGVEIAQ